MIKIEIENLVNVPYWKVVSQCREGRCVAVNTGEGAVGREHSDVGKPAGRVETRLQELHH